MTLYQSIVQLALEFSSTAWSPYTKKDIEALEKVQARCLRLCSNETKTTIESLQERRQKTDLIDTYKYLNDISKNNSEKLCSKQVLRGHTTKLFQRNTRTKLASHFFSNLYSKQCLSSNRWSPMVPYFLCYLRADLMR